MIPRNAGRVALGCLVISILAAAPANALCPVPQPRLVCAEYLNSTAVVTARLMKTRVAGDYDGFFYTMLVRSTMRGAVPSSFRIYEENTSGRASFEWKLGRTYLLFMRYSKPDRAWVIDGCGNSGPLAQKAAIVNQIHSVRSSLHKDAIVEGLASRRETSIDPIPNVIIIATLRRNGKTFRTTTAANGRFRLQLPSGTYRLKAIRKGMDFQKPEALSYEDARKLNLVAGSCAQVQFTAAEQ